MKIGVFDSGIGGITVLNQVLNTLPYDEVVYLCDGKYMPYGNKSHQFIRERMHLMLEYFAQQNCDLVFIACHSMASIYLQYKDDLHFDMQITNTIEPTCNFLNKGISQKIGIMATERTIANGTYAKLLKKHEVVNFPCKELATIIEQNFHGKQLVPDEFLAEILPDAKILQLDKLVLACTHYPHAIEQIKQWVHVHAPKCEIIDPAEIIVQSCKVNNTRSKLSGSQKVLFYTTGDTKKLETLLHSLYKTQDHFKSINVSNAVV